MLNHLANKQILIILDGFGATRDETPGNAICRAQMPFWENWLKKYPIKNIQASGQYVGLKPGTAGNSEAGHLNLGAGRTVEQDPVRISQAIADGSFFTNDVLLEAIQRTKKNGRLHFMGLLSSEQSAHSQPDHLQALLSMASAHHLENVFVHLFTDGRDTSPFAGKDLVKIVEPFLGNAKIASIVGRAYAMDRKKDWTHTQKAYELMTLGQGLSYTDATTALAKAYERGESDEFVSASWLYPDKRATIQNGDTIVFFNCRSDRARQLTKVFVQDDFEAVNFGAFERKPALSDLFFVALSDFGPDLNVKTAFATPHLSGTLPAAWRGVPQMYVAEKEKYAHITYFFNGWHAKPVYNATWECVPSPDVLNYSAAPAMGAREITDKIIAGINSSQYDFLACNFANADMLAHTGDIEATKKGLEIMDGCLGRIVEAAHAKNASVFITADHGNAEMMLDLKTGAVRTEHTSNPVPLMFLPPPSLGTWSWRTDIKEDACLADVATTILAVANVPLPREMLGRRLLQ